MIEFSRDQAAAFEDEFYRFFVARLAKAASDIHKAVAEQLSRPEGASEFLSVLEGFVDETVGMALELGLNEPAEQAALLSLLLEVERDYRPVEGIDDDGIADANRDRAAFEAHLVSILNRSGISGSTKLALLEIWLTERGGYSPWFTAAIDRQGRMRGSVA